MLYVCDALVFRLKQKYWLSRVMTWQKLYQVLSQLAKSTSLLLVSLLRATFWGTQNLPCTNWLWNGDENCAILVKWLRKSKGTRTSSRICKSVPSFCMVYAVSKGGLSMVYSPGSEGGNSSEIFQVNESSNSELYSDDKSSVSGKVSGNFHCVARIAW